MTNLDVRVRQQTLNENRPIALAARQWHPAMADAIERLRTLPRWDEWNTFHAQGAGSLADSDHFAVIKMCRGEIAFEQQLKLDVPAVTKRAGAPESCLIESDGSYSLAKATPLEAARIMDVILREYLEIRPHDGEGDDYAIGAEW